MSWRQSDSAIRNENKQSRAINLNVAQADVRIACDKRGIGVSSIETLHSGGTRVVLVNSEGADQVRLLYRTKIMDGPVVRIPWTSNR